MSTNSTEKQTMLNAISTINAVEGFDPTPLAVGYTDLNTGEKRLRLPVMIQVAWFRLKYPEGRISIKVKPSGNFFVADAKVYKNYNDPVDSYLAEASASRGPLADKPTVSPREWAQTAAVGIALRNAGFGLQFHAAGESFDAPAVDELGQLVPAPKFAQDQAEVLPEKEAPAGAPLGMAEDIPISDGNQEPPMQTAATLAEETPLEKAMKLPCPASKYKDKTLGDMVSLNPGIFPWIINKFGEASELGAGAKLICEHAMQVTA